MIDRVLTKIFGTQHERDIKKLLPRVRRINALEPSIKALSDEALRARTAEFRARLTATLEGVPEEDVRTARTRALDELLEEAFAVVREASVRSLGMRPFDVQLIGGMVLRGHVYAIVDEVDSILIDEARTPLIISGPSEENTDIYYQCNRAIPYLKQGKEEKDKYGNKTTTGDYLVDEKSRTAVLTEEG